MSKIRYATLEEAQEVFGSEIAGNQEVHCVLPDGAQLCSYDHDDIGRVLFLAHDAALSDWDIVTPDEFTAILCEAQRH